MITDEEFVRISSYMKGKYGIDLSHKKVIINGRLDNYLKSNGCNDCSEYLNAIKADRTGALEKILVNLLTTNHTYFMREFEHFEYFQKIVLPWIKMKESHKRDLRIWCGAASSGEEPYMIAMVLQDFFGMEKEKWDTRILATDVSTKVLKRAITGVYSAQQLENIPSGWKKRFFTERAQGGEYQVTDELKRQVLFRQFNLMNPFPFRKKMHTVFLRNVMIYFDEETKIELLQKVYHLLEPGGYLFIGTTETIDRNSVPFQILQPSIFRKREGND